jgi:hypothetical protein
MSTVVYNDFKDYIVSCIFGLGNDSYDFSNKGIFSIFWAYFPFKSAFVKKIKNDPSKK